MSKKNNHIKHWFLSGMPYIWLNAGAVSILLIMVVGLVLLIAVHGLAHFWPDKLISFDYQQENDQVISVLGVKVDEEDMKQPLTDEQHVPSTAKRWLMKLGNRDLIGLDFQWVDTDKINNIDYPKEAIIIERRGWGNAHGYLQTLLLEGEPVFAEDPWGLLDEILQENTDIFEQIEAIEKIKIGAINHKLERLRLKKRKLDQTKNDSSDLTGKYQVLLEEKERFEARYLAFTSELEKYYQTLNRWVMVMTTASGDKLDIPLAKVVKIYRPNAMNLFEKIGFYCGKLYEFIVSDPREANTEGGVFPAIFGTVMMVFIMSILVTPFGVMTAVYLHEYAKQGVITRFIRIAVNNLAGVPSIVYGVFGLGFFVYFLGGFVDQLFFSLSLPNPTFGTPGILWASLTLALLTMPVVIVSTEEGLSRVPNAIREGSFALGATKAETLWLTILPMTAPAIMTGLILAIARAAGEVAPLMLVGVVKLAPSLPVDGNSPFVHLNRKFMHLGFHIYDVGFQSPNVEAARPLVYATALLLITIIILLNLAAFKIRNDLREKYRATEQ